MPMEPGRGDGRPGPVLPGVGLDAEQVARFDKLAAGMTPWRYVYSDREIRHLAAQPQAARAFCAAFCCKEAFCKALGESYSFPQLECFYRAGDAEPELLLSPALAEGRGLEEVRVRVDDRFLGERGEMVAEVYLTRVAGSRRESLAVATVEAGRALIVEEHFAPGEIADLGNRRVQSLAGFLALKRALVDLWAGAGTAAPRDFELGHHESGAPRIVAAPAGVVPESTLISISHTRTWAYGLAAIREREGRR